MESLRQAYRRIKALFTRDVLERDLDDEMRLHMDLLAEEYEGSGVPAEEARRLARRRFGNLVRIKEKGRDIRGAGVLDDLARDLQIRTTGDPFAVVPEIREVIRRIDTDLPLTGIRTQNQEIDRTFSSARTLVPIWAIFGGVALLLTCMGLYGLMSYSVAQRTNEIGVRMALGARRIHVMRIVMGQMLRLVLIGLGLGLAGSVVANQAIRRSIYGVTLYDPVTITGVIATLLIVAVVAGYQPLRRASKIDPTIALRCE